MTSLEPEIWFLVRGGRRAGPYDRAELLRELLALEAPEAGLVWRSGLPAWTKAGLLDDLRRDLPPPVPGASLAMPAVPEAPDPPLPEEADSFPSSPPETPSSEPGGPGPDGRTGTPSTPPLSDGDFAGEGGEPATLEEEARSRRRRKRRHRHPRATTLPGYAIPLALLFVAVMVGLWFLLRRMNEVPPGRIILQGAVSPRPLTDSRPAATPA